MDSWNKIYFSTINICNIKGLRWSQIREKMIMHHANEQMKKGFKVGPRQERVSGSAIFYFLIHESEYVTLYLNISMVSHCLQYKIHYHTLP